jgi:20S proteasome alpha/beta subunit
VVAGLDIKKDGTLAPFIASTDTIGCINFAKDFVVCGVTGPELYGMCESLWEPNLVHSFAFAVCHLMSKKENIKTSGARGSVRDHLAGDAERSGQRRPFRLGRRGAHNVRPFS